MYKKYTTIKDNIILTTQGFDSSIHKPLCEFENKKGVAFIGLYEKEREIILQNILDAKINVTLAGPNWDSFYKKNYNNPHLNYLQKGAYGSDYSKVISSSLFGLGLLSKRMPELHTTRTFEIPACGTALITEINSETIQYFNSSEAIFFNNPTEIVQKILYYSSNLDKLKIITDNGFKRVCVDKRDYENIVRKILIDSKIL